MSRGILVAVLQASVLLLPLQSVASPRPLDFSGSEEASGFYVSGSYKPALPSFSGFAVEVSDGVVDLFALKKDEAGAASTLLSSKESFEGEYSPRYVKNWQAGSVSMGYSTGYARVEAEGMYQKFAVDSSGFTTKENAGHFAAAVMESKASRELQEDYVTIENNGVVITSLIGNVCYDPLSGTSSSLSPTLCVGIGGSLVEFLGVTALRASYQAKIGIQYSFSPAHVLFLNAYANMVQTKKFDGIPVVYQKSGDSHKHIYPSGKLKMGYWGAECGLRLSF